MIIPDGDPHAVAITHFHDFAKSVMTTTMQDHPPSTTIMTSLPPVTTTTSAIVSASAAIESASLAAADATPCAWPGCWYNSAWATPLTWMLFCYCFVSAFIMFSLWCGGYLDWKLNLADPYDEDLSRRQATSTNEIWHYQQHRYRQRQRDRAAARRDPAAELFEEFQRRYSAVGIHVSIEQLQYQTQSLERAPAARHGPQSPRTGRSLSESPDLVDELRALERERRDRIVVARLWQQGLM